jgi:DNA repair photolyase
MTHKTEGTKEWAYKNLNICYGCPHDCDYCYAKSMAKRFKRIEDEEDWSDWRLNHDKIEKGYRKLQNPNPDLPDYMFPTSHDIFPEILEESIVVLKKVLKAGNSVLITTKPHIKCIERICKDLKRYKGQIRFRFTITSLSKLYSPSKTRLAKFEPGAPGYYERKASLAYAHSKGFETSVSIEPFLDRNPIPLVKELEQFVTNTLWIGIMSGRIPAELHSIYQEENVGDIYLRCSELPPRVRHKIRFKDSIVNKLELTSNKLQEVLA